VTGLVTYKRYRISVLIKPVGRDTARTLCSMVPTYYYDTIGAYVNDVPTKRRGQIQGEDYRGARGPRKKVIVTSARAFIKFIARTGRRSRNTRHDVLVFFD